MKLKEIGEFGLIRRMRSSLKDSQRNAVLGIGDDGAALKIAPGKLTLVTLDTLVENTHFKWDYASPRQVGWKALAVNISDIAAMGGVPTYCVVGLGLSGTLEVDLVDGLCEGLKEIAARYGIGLVGGDIVRSSEFFITVCLLGEVAGGRICSRSGAKPGDLIFVTGELGAAAAGLACFDTAEVRLESGKRELLVQKHLRPSPRLKEGQWIAARRIATAMIDISDGLISDFSRIREESRVGAVLWEEAIPVALPAVELACSLGRSPQGWALYGGEDYELLFTASPDKRKLLDEEAPFPFSVIGEVRQWQEGMVLKDPEGRHMRIGEEGYNHLADAPRRGKRP